MKIYFSFAVLLVIVVIGCSSTKTTETTTPAMAATTGLEHGKSLYEKNCQTCHALKDPKAFTEDKLRKMVPIMATKAKIDATTQSEILNYVIAMNKQ